MYDLLCLVGNLLQSNTHSNGVACGLYVVCCFTKLSKAVCVFSCFVMHRKRLEALQHSHTNLEGLFLKTGIYNGESKEIVLFKCRT